MKWVAFKASKVALKIIESKTTSTRLACVLPKYDAPKYTTDTELGLRLFQLGFKYQDYSNAWFRPTAGLRIADFESLLPNDAYTVELDLKDVVLDIDQKKSKNNTEANNSKKEKTHDKRDGLQEENADRRGIGAGNGEAGTPRSAGDRKVREDKPRSPDRVKQSGDNAEKNQPVFERSRELDGSPSKPEKQFRPTSNGSHGGIQSRPIGSTRAGNVVSTTSTPERHKQLNTQHSQFDTQDSPGFNDNAPLTPIAETEDLFSKKAEADSRPKPDVEKSSNEAKADLLQAPEEPDEPEEPEEPPKNYHPPQRGIKKLRKKPAERLADNIQALKILYEKDPDELDLGELSAIDEFSGWGGLLEKISAASVREEMASLMTADELVDARESSLTAFYTADNLAASIWDLLKRHGYSGGRGLESSAGTGVFLSQRLNELDDKQHFTAVELDSLSSRILKAKFPAARVENLPFEQTRFVNESFDFAIGNVPFGEMKIYDDEGKPYSLHNYFLKRKLDLCREGGVTAIITSPWTLNSKSVEFRKEIAGKADLVSAMALPSGVFADSNTGAESHLLVFKKRPAGTPYGKYGGIPFIKMAEERYPAEKEFSLNSGTSRNKYKKGESVGVVINEAFLNGGELIGTPYSTLSRFGDRAELGLKATLNEVCEHINSISPSNESERWFDDINLYATKGYDGVKPNIEKNTIRVEDKVTPGTLLKRDGEFVVVADVFREKATRYAVVEPVKIPKTRRPVLEKLLTLKQIAKKQIELESRDAPDEEVEKNRENLSVLYDQFVSKHGPIHGKIPRETLKLDFEGYFLCGLEKYDDETGTAEKADIFYKRIAYAPKEVTSADNLEEACAISFSKSAKFDPEIISNLLQMDFEEALKKWPDVLLFSPDKMQWDLRCIVLDGDVKSRLELAESMDDPRLNKTITSLKAVLPADLAPEDVFVTLASTWLNPKYIEQFAEEMLLKEGVNTTFQVKRTSAGADVDAGLKESGQYGIYHQAMYKTLGTEKRDFSKLLMAALNNDTIRITKTIKSKGQEKTVTDKKATLNANAKLDDIKDSFTDWIWQDPDRTRTVCEYYNATKNRHNFEDFKFSSYKFEGLSPLWTPRPHQRDYVVKALMTGSMLNAHCVGAGKTLQMAMLAYERVRLGMSTREFVAIPNHMLFQIHREFSTFYPDAKIAMIDKEDLKQERRKAFLSKLVMNQWDIIVLTHSVNKRISMSPDYQLDFYAQRIADYENFLKGADDISERRIQARLRTLKSKAAAQQKRLEAKSEIITFEALAGKRFGFHLDEAHGAKNLEPDAIVDVRGVPASTSDFATDILMKARYAQRCAGSETGVYFYTATPVSNALPETYTMTRFLKPSLLKSSGINNLADWVGAFGEVTTELKVKPEGGGFYLVTRLARLNNVREALCIFRSHTDIKHREDLNLPSPPFREEFVVADQSIWQKEFSKHLTARAVAIRDGDSNECFLNIVTDGRKSAMDMRLIDPRFPEEENTKIQLAVDNMLQIYDKYSDIKAAQLVFCDVSTPATKKDYDPYNDVKRRLMARGVPEDEIAFIQDYKKDKDKEALFEKVRNGVVRFLFGSTSTMGTGTNVQRLLAAIHNLDSPWRPSDLEQRLGRAVRQGNLLDFVVIYNYTTQDSFDLYMWETNREKAIYISQVMKDPDSAARTIEADETNIDFATAVQVTTGDTTVRDKVEVDAKVLKLQRRRTSHYARKSQDESLLKTVKIELPSKKRLLAKLEKALNIVVGHAEERAKVDRDFSITIYKSGDHESSASWIDATEAAKKLDDAFTKARLRAGPEGRLYDEILESVGSYLGVEIKPYSRSEKLIELGGIDTQISETAHWSLRRIVEAPTCEWTKWRGKTKEAIQNLETTIANLSSKEYGMWPGEAELQVLMARQKELTNKAMELADKAAAEQPRVEEFGELVRSELGFTLPTWDAEDVVEADFTEIKGNLKELAEVDMAPAL